MKNKSGNKKTGKVRTFFKGLVEKIDKKMEEKARKGPSCCSGKSGGSPCCG